MNPLFERSKVRSISNFPISTGIWPDIALFCSNLQKATMTKKHIHQITWTMQCFGKQNFKNIHKNIQKTYTDSNLVRFWIAGDNIPDTLWLGSPLQTCHKLLQSEFYTKIERKKKVYNDDNIHTGQKHSHLKSK